MKDLMTLILMLALGALVITLAAHAVVHWRQVRRNTASNATTAGTHANGQKPYSAEEALSTRYLLVTAGTAPATQVLTANATLQAIGVCPDEPAADDYTNISLLGVSPGTLLMVASEAITAGEIVYQASGGKVQDPPAANGTYWRVGIALSTASADGDQIEVAHHVATEETIVVE